MGKKTLGFSSLLLCAFLALPAAEKTYKMQHLCLQAHPEQAPKDVVQRLYELQVGDEKIKDWGRGQEYSQSKLLQLCEEVVKYLSAEGYIGVSASVDSSQIDEYGNDLRAFDEDVRLHVCFAYIGSVHTRRRFFESEEVTTDDPGLRYLVKNMPYDLRENQILHEGLLQSYLLRLNRYQASDVTASLDEIAPDGRTDIEFVVKETKSWSLWANVSNTGYKVENKESSRWIERFGYLQRELFGCADILSLEYMTASFDNLYGVAGAYESSFYTSNWRWGVEAGYSNFNIQALELEPSLYESWSWRAAPYAVWNFYQCDELFLDLRLQSFWYEFRVKNEPLASYGNQTFFAPMALLSAVRNRRWDSFKAWVGLQRSFGVLGGTRASQQDLSDLGRLNTKRDWMILSYYFFGSIYVDKDKACALNEPCSPRPVHELALLLQGQYAFGQRLIPQMEAVIGGLYTVRGYDSVAASGDNAAWLQAEYRFHPFRHQSRSFLRAFFDIGWCDANKPVFSEGSTTLAGTGLGMEAMWKLFLLRADVGLSLKGVPERGEKAGVVRGYVSATIGF